MFRFLHELRRRHVFRGAGIYLIVSWTLLQVADVVAEPAGLPAWSVSALLYVLVLGFPLALLLSWRYDFTEDGLVRTRSRQQADDEVPAEPLKLADFALLGGVLAISVFIGIQVLPDVARESMESAEEKTAEAEVVPERPIDARSIAVMPFANVGLSESNAYLADGISDTVTHLLAQVSGLTVTARTSAFAYRDTKLSVRDIARALGVALLLEGSVQQAGNRLRVIARLVDGETGAEEWSNQYTREVNDIFALQDAIAEDVASSMEVTLSGGGSVPDRYQPKLEAYEKFILAESALEQQTARGAEQAIALFEEAIEIDPNYALAYVRLAEATQAYGFTVQRSPRETLERVSELADAALEIDPLLPEAFVARGMVQVSLKDYESARRSFEKALQMNANLPEAYAALGNYWQLQGDNEKSLENYRRATDLDPESVQLRETYAAALWKARSYEQSIGVLKDVIKRNPTLPGPYAQLARRLKQMGRPGESAFYLYKILQREPDNPSNIRQMCEEYWQLWQNELAIDCFEAYVRQNPQDDDGRYWLEGIRGNIDRAVEIAEGRVEENPTFWYPRMQLANLLVRDNRWEEAIEVVSPAYPTLFETDPVINDYNQWGAHLAAVALLRSGEEERGRTLARAVLEYVEQEDMLPGAGWLTGIEDAMMLSLLGDREEALRRLEAAVDWGWMFYSADAMFAPSLDPLRDDPRFEALVERIQANLDEEYAWFLEHREDPLFGAGTGFGR